jgi:hypothetical protein
MNENMWGYDETVSYKDILSNTAGSMGNDGIITSITKKRDMKDIENYIKEHYDMTLEELDEFIMKYEPERTV